MLRTIKAVIDPLGNVHLQESVRLPEERAALVTILDEGPIQSLSETAVLSEQALAEDWNRSEEDTAWSHLQSAQ
ncbi:MAG: hypothetical protein NPIRA02_04400 [Nitrospirales bacterium]|nr:MAG: hypothetical protein NPIRA02_04400 [Nitrospirales bacterium]